MFLVIFDAWFLDKCEKFSHRTQRILGLTCFDLARICLGIGLTVCMPVFFFVQKEFLVWGLPVSALTVFHFFETYSIEKITLKYSLHGLANPYKKRMSLRITAYSSGAILIYCVSLFASLFFIIPYSGLLFLYVCYLYFLSCDPLPPAKSKVRALIEKIRESLRPAPIPAPQES